jgi:IrrE N-terminal-like domain
MSRISHTVSPLSRPKIAAKAAEIRLELGSYNIERIDLLAIIEHQSIKALRGWRLVVLGDDELTQAPASVEFTEKTLSFRETEYLAAFRGDGRSRFTAGHELGHIVLHARQKSVRDLVVFRSPRLMPPVFPNKNQSALQFTQDSEWQADVFAAEFLMPAHLCLRMNSSEEIEEKCGVSSEAAKIRFRYLSPLRNL